ncbi:MAG: hypothetical protein JRN35_09830, partial [Nitrososphaerota archaeon]|nr:hypothetical protein [Nitrososphaerota archaeon]
NAILDAGLNSEEVKLLTLLKKDYPQDSPQQLVERVKERTRIQPLVLELQPDLFQALKRYAKSRGVTEKQAVIRAVEDILAEEGLWKRVVSPLTKDGVPDALERERLTMMSKNTANEIEKQIATEADTDPNRVILHMQSIKIKLYERFEQSLGKKEKPILIFNRDGSVTSLDEVSSISASLEPIRKILVFAPASKRAKVREISEGIFHAKSKY